MLSRRALASTLAAGSLGTVLPVPRAAGQLAAAQRLAPEFVGIDGWINTPDPLTLTGLRGKVVLVDFWTYSCINCRRTVPYLNRWQAEYGPHGLQIVGIHTPEFGFERARHNVMDAVREFGIGFPVGQDNAFQTWRAWANRAWPSFYLLDRGGRIVLLREGEGHARETEAAIRALLGLPPRPMAVPGDDPDLSRIVTPEVYFGALHPTPQDSMQRPRPGQVAYTFPAAPPRINEYQLDGTWVRQRETLDLHSPRGGVRLRFSAAKLHLVAAAATPVTLRVASPGRPTQAVQVARPTLYTLVDGSEYREHTVELEADGTGLSLFSATFG